MKIALFLLYCLLILSNILIAQENNFHLQFNHLSSQEGLSNTEYNNSIFQDSKGFVWISSIDGLNRYNGNSIRTYHKEKGLVGKNIQGGFFEDLDSNIWFSTYQALNCYHRDLDSIFHIPILDKNNNLIEQDYQIIYLDTLFNKLWFTADGFLHNLDVLNPDLYASFNHKSKGKHFSVKIVNDRFFEIIASPRMLGNGIEQYMIQDTSIVDCNFYFPNYFQIKKTLALEDSLWIFFKQNKIHFFNGETYEAKNSSSSLANYKFWDAIRIDEKNLLLSTNGNGLKQYNLDTHKFETSFNNGINKPYGLSSSSPRELYLTKDNILWTSSRNKGVDYGYLYSNLFDNPLSKISDESLKIVSVFENYKKDIWIATPNHIYILHPNNGLKELVIKKEYIGQNKKYAQVLQVNENEYLILTNSSLTVYDNASKEYYSIELSTDLFLLYLSKVSRDRIFLSTNKGMKEIYFDKNYKIKDCKEFSNFTSFDFFLHFQTSQNLLYVPYKTKDLLIYKATKSGLKLLTKKTCNAEFFCFYESQNHQNLVWAGTSNGLLKITQDTIVDFVPNLPAVLKNKNIYAIIEDQNATLWLGTDKGLWQYDPKSEKAYLYEVSDGLINAQFSPFGAAVLADDGKIWMGTADGIVQFDPLKIKPYSIAPKIFVNYMEINDHEKNKGIDGQKECVLSYDKNTFAFDIDAIGFYKNDQSVIEYQLSGYDDQFLQIPNGQKIRYAKVPAGAYTFQAKAIDVNGNESKWKSIRIEIAPPWWRTWWFRVLLFVIGVYLVNQLYQFRIRKIKKEAAVLRREAEFKQQVAETKNAVLRLQMNPHFIFNAMNSINSYIINKQDEKAGTYLKKFANLMRLILDFSNEKLIPLEDEVEFLKLYLATEQMRFDHGFTFEINYPDDFDFDDYLIPPMLLQPFVENALKHGFLHKKKDGKIKIEFEEKDNQLHCKIKDNGVGLSTMKKLGQGAHQSKAITITTQRLQLINPDHSKSSSIEISNISPDDEFKTGTEVLIKLALFALS